MLRDVFFVSGIRAAVLFAISMQSFITSSFTVSYVRIFANFPLSNFIVALKSCSDVSFIIL